MQALGSLKSASRVGPIVPNTRRRSAVACVARSQQQPSHDDVTGADVASRRALLAAATAITLAAGMAPMPAAAFSGNPLSYKKELSKRRRKIPEEEYTDGERGIKYYDIEVGGGAEAKIGARVAVHYDLKWRNITFMTSRQGMGVTGGTPLGWDVGRPAGEAGGTLEGLDIGVRGMRVGGLRRVIVPPELGYGSRGIGEIPPNATLMLDIELLSIKTNPLGYRTKLVEG